MTWERMGCCGAVLGGPHEFGCEDAIPWSEEERQEGEEIARAADREAREWLEATR